MNTTSEDGFPLFNGLKWSGRDRMATPPAIGAPITVTMNGLGPATVLAYRDVEGYLGLEVELHAPPEFYVKQNGKRERHFATIFGAEVAPPDRTTNRGFAGEYAKLAADQKRDIERIKAAMRYIRPDAKYRADVAYVIDQAELNANQTVFDEHAQPPSEWGAMFIGSIGTIMCMRKPGRDDYNAFTERFFLTNGVKW